MSSVTPPEHSIDRLTLLYRLSQTFNSSLDLDEVLNKVMDEVIAAINAERGFVMLHEPDQSLTFRVARGMDHSTIEDPAFTISRSIVEHVAQEAEPILTLDAQSDERFSHRSSVSRLGLRSIICMPLKFKDDLLGVIYVDNRLQAGIFTNDDLELLKAIASSAAIAIENARLYKVAVEKGRMERELQMAYQVQSSLIPSETPKITGWDFASHWRPAREVAGDYFDFIEWDNGCLSLVIADVTDKGMPAALFMALTRSILRASLHHASSPNESITKANRLICADSTSNMPVTLFYSLLEPESGEITYVNAGHNPPLHYRCEEDEFIELTRTGIPLGFDDETTFDQQTQVISPGDFIIFYTDGVTDAMNAEGEEFGMKRFRDLIQDHRTAAAVEILEAIKHAIDDFIDTTAPYDDITIIIAKRINKKS